MPILDPLLQFELTRRKNVNSSSKSKSFIKKYLHFASLKLCSNLNSTLAYIKFKKDFEKSMPYINKQFLCKFTGADLKVPNLYDLFNKSLDCSEEVEGNYFRTRSINSVFNFFQPYVDFSEYHSWYLTDTPIAILFLNITNLQYELFQLVQLEIDLMQASGYTLVLIINIKNFEEEEEKKSVKNVNDSFHTILNDIILGNNFAEIHINNDMDGYSSIFYNIIKRIEQSKECTSYFYIYSRHFSNPNGLIKIMNDVIKKLKNKARMKIIRFGGSIESSLKTFHMEPIKPFQYCSNGFQYDLIKIILCDVPLYDSDDENQNIISTDFANINNYFYIGFIKPNDFLFWNKNRVEVVLFSQEKGYFSKFVDFDDIHFINPYLYVKHPINLAKVKLEEINTIEQIIKETHEKFEENEDDEFKKEFFFSLFKQKKAVQLLKYVLYACKKHISGFKFFKSQIFVAYRAINFCILRQEDFTNHGFVYQVATGEGKSYIVILIAAVLALFKKTVHIVTSSITLTNRDYNTYYDFFKSLGLKTAALIHDNEKPLFENEQPPIIEEHYPNEFYGEELFKNSMKMNFNVCGVLSNKNKADIIFSTLMNFECLYLYMNEKVPGRVSEYYKSSSIVIDEADLILIDELTNGTILSRPMKTNAEDVLSYVYETKTKHKLATAQEIFDHIKENWPECTDLTIKDVENMFEEIKLVNTDEEFVADKKYAIVPINSGKKRYNQKRNHSI